MTSLTPSLTITPHLTHRLKLLPEVRQALFILQMSLPDLKVYLREELAQNPALEEAEGNAPGLDGIEGQSAWEEDESVGEGGGEWNEERERKRLFRMSLLTKPCSLEEHLLGQLDLLDLPEGERAAAREIAGSLDANGYLVGPLELIADRCRVKIGEVERALSAVQTLDPKGVGARNLQECLLIQLGEDSPAGLIVKNYLSDLKLKRFQKIAKGLGVSVQEVEKAVQRIRRLDPKPGRNFDVPKSAWIVPDLVVYRTRKTYRVRHNPSELAALEINARYQKYLTEKAVPRETKRYLREKLRSGLQLIEAVKKRRETVEKVAGFAVREQAGFFEKGPSALKALRFEEAASALGIHKSTVWRAAANKYMETPRGIIELKSLFSSPLSEAGPSTSAVKSRIRDLIAGEDKKAPLSDERLVDILRSEGIPLARRTAAKYREALKILPSYLRKT
ncbi:MAG: RNA polymerase factor sigma-54 [Candidatus Omnitrophica bacterium]|nr:RNA polymerase factor sigma-54 [Candidatus Omnitrophota bacterium]